MKIGAYTGRAQSRMTHKSGDLSFLSSFTSSGIEEMNGGSKGHEVLFFLLLSDPFHPLGYPERIFCCFWGS